MCTFRLFVPPRFVRQIFVVSESASAPSWTEMEVADEMVKWLKEHTPTYKLRDSYYNKVVEFTNHNDVILFKLTFDVEGGPIDVKVDLER